MASETSLVMGGHSEETKADELNGTTHRSQSPGHDEDSDGQLAMVTTTSLF